MEKPMIPPPTMSTSAEHFTGFSPPYLVSSRPFVVGCIQRDGSCLYLWMSHDKDGFAIHELSGHTEFPFVFQCNDMPPSLNEIVDRILLAFAQDPFNKR